MGLGGAEERERRRRVCGAKMTEIRETATQRARRGAATAARRRDGAKPCKAEKDAAQHQAAKADRRGKDGWAAQPRLHWDGFDWNRWGVGEVNDGW